MAQNKPALTLSPAEEDAVIKERLITKTGLTTQITWQKKVMIRFATFSASLMSDKGLEESERLFDTLMETLKVMVLPVEMTFLKIEASRKDAEVARGLHEATLQEIADTRMDIERLKNDLAAARVERKNQEECETIRELIAAQPSRAQSTKSIEETQKDIAGMEQEIEAAGLAVELRKKQFATLIHVIDSIQTEIQEEKFLAIVRNQQGQERGEALPTELTPDPMLVDDG